MSAPTVSQLYMQNFSQADMLANLEDGLYTTDFDTDTGSAFTSCFTSAMTSGIQTLYEEYVAGNGQPHFPQDHLQAAVCHCKRRVAPSLTIFNHHVARFRHY